MAKKSRQSGLKGFRRQRCRVCECEEKYNFHVSDEIWEKVVPKQFQTRVVCLSCFDNFARQRDVDYSHSINDFSFVGDKAAVEFEPKSAQDI